MKNPKDSRDHLFNYLFFILVDSSPVQLFCFDALFFLFISKNNPNFRDGNFSPLPYLSHQVRFIFKFLQDENQNYFTLNLLERPRLLTLKSYLEASPRFDLLVHLFQFFDQKIFFNKKLIFIEIIYLNLYLKVLKKKIHF